MANEIFDALNDRQMYAADKMNEILDKLAKRIPKMADAAPVNAVAASGKLTFTDVVIDGETVTVGDRVYEFDGDGVVTSGNVAVDVSASMTASQGVLSIDTQPTAYDTMTVGDRTYVFVPDGDEGADGEVSIGADLDEAQVNVVAAINGTDGANTANAHVTAADFSDNDCVLTAISVGSVGDAIATTETFSTSSDVAQIEEITCVADSADSLDGTYFQLSDSAGTVGVWIDTDDSGTAIPAGASALDRAIEVATIATGDIDSAVATAIAAAIDTDSEFSASATGAVITVTQATAGRVEDAVDGNTGFSFSVDTQGVNANAFDADTLGTETAGVDCPAADAETALVAAIDGDEDAVVDAAADTGDTAVDVTALVASTSGNDIDTTETCANAAWGAVKLEGGVDATPGAAMEQVINGTKLYVNRSDDDTGVTDAAWHSADLTLVSA